MLYNLILKVRGKEQIVFTNTLPKCKARKKKLSESQRGGFKGNKVEYFIIPADTDEKFKKKPHNPRIGGGDVTVPRKVKWG